MSAQGKRGEKKERQREVLTGQFQAVGPDGPMIPQATVQVPVCLQANADNADHFYLFLFYFMDYAQFFNDSSIIKLASYI